MDIDVGVNRLIAATLGGITIFLLATAALHIWKVNEDSITSYLGLSTGEGDKKGDKFAKYTAKIAIFIIYSAIIAISTAASSAYYFKSDGFGQIGDLVGGIINPLASLLAFIIVAASIQIQKAELSATRMELAESAKAQASHVKIVDSRNAEDRFFRLVDDLENSINSLSFNVSHPPSDLPREQAFEMLRRRIKPTETGRDAIRRIIEIHNNNLFAKRPDPRGDLDRTYPETARFHYGRIRDEMEGQTTKIYLIFSIVAAIIDSEIEKRVCIFTSPDAW
jgi:hypothetical protein